MIHGDRVVLRSMEPADTDDVLRMRSAPEVVAQLFTEKPMTRDGHLSWLEQITAQGIRQEFMIVEHVSGQSIGTVGLSHIDTTHRRAEFGILIGQAEARRKGRAFEAGRLLLDYAFNKLGLHRVFLHVFADNEPAIRLYRKLGFVEEGLLRQHVFKNGRYRDVVVMGMHQGV